MNDVLANEIRSLVDLSQQLQNRVINLARIIPALATQEAAEHLQQLHDQLVAQPPVYSDPATINYAPAPAAPEAAEGVTLFEHANYQGSSVTLAPGSYKMAQIALPNDSISSLKVPDGHRVFIYEHENFEGEQRFYTTDCDFVGDFNDKTSSIVVEGPNQKPMMAA